MNELKGKYVEGTAKTPQVEFNHLTGELVLEGRSIPENAGKVYEPLVDWINEYVKSPCNTTNFHLNLEYFNSASLIWITKIIITLSKTMLPGAIVYIHMYFEIEDFEDGISDELSDLIEVLSDKIHEAPCSIAFKTHGIDSSGKEVKEFTILV
jgi:hypothetical protein